MKWKRMMFKGCKVYAPVDGEGNLLIQKGKVEIKYQLDQDMKYLARASLVKEIDEALLKEIRRKRRKENKNRPKTMPSPSPLLPRDYDSISVFTDGACEGNPGPAGIGIVLQYRNHRKEIARFIGEGTNNIAELIAIKTALKEIKDPHLSVNLYTDSAYCQKTLNGSWKPKKNRKLIEEIKKEMTRFPSLHLIKVEGHKGIEGNERANRLAQQAVHKKRADSERKGRV